MGQKKHRILLTGASGTLGRNFLDLIGNNPNYEICSLLRIESRTVRSYQSVLERRADLLDRVSVTKVVEDFRPDTIVHCAATGMEFPKTEWFDLLRFNVDFTVNLCESASRIGISHFVYISTGLAYKPMDRPLNEDDPLDTLHPYGSSKAAADLLLRAAAFEFGVPLTVLRPFSFTGLGDDRNRLFPSILRAASLGKRMDLTSAHQSRDHISARDVARGVLASIQNVPETLAPRIYNLGGGSSLTVRSLVEGVVSELNIPVELRFGAKALGRFEPGHLVADFSRARKELGWIPTHRLSHAVFELSKESFPDLNLSEPKELIE
ncbi:MAG: NAD(P)-dependent oxidoreductase [Opitutaceae bacterium]